MFKRLSKRAKELLPWYVNGRLTTTEQEAVERWLHHSPDGLAELAEWQQVRTAVSGQAQQEPSPEAWRRVTARVRSLDDSHGQPQILPRLAWVWGGMLAVAIVALLWVVVQPGIVLQWSVNDGPLTAFRVYRAPVGSTDFELVYEIRAQPDSEEYTFIDAALWPGQTYVYRVEGLNPGEQPAVSQAITANALEALPSQLAVILVGLIGGYGAAMLVQQLRLVGGGRWGLGRLMT
jgi:hypothetical protein